ncbi:MAG: OmpA family protein [Flavobacteriales bacterium]
MSNGIQDENRLRAWNGNSPSQLYTSQKGDDFGTYENIQRLFSHRGNRDEGAVTVNLKDSVFYFSSANNYGAGRDHGKQKIFAQSFKKGAKFFPELISFCDDDAEYSSPFYDDELNVMVFASTREGGHGSWDIWFSYKSGDEWTQPANCGGQVNTSAAEIFPTIFEGDIYFSSNGWLPERGYDIFKSEGKEQWMNAIQLEYPINTEYNDYRILFINDQRGLISSDRKGSIGGSDIFLFGKTVQKFATTGYSGLLMANGVELPSATLQFYNEANELLTAGTTTAEGVIDLKDLQLEVKYRVKLSGVVKELFPLTDFYILDSYGNKIRKYTFNEKGELVLELLKFVYSDIKLLENNDYSSLSIAIEGRVIAQSTSSNVSKIPIAIVDDNGEIIAVAITDELGEFNFDQLKPQRYYQFKLSKKSKLDRIVLFDNGKSVVLPILSGDAYYQRLAPHEGIEMVTDNGEKIVVKDSYVFIVNRVYFDLNSSNLTSESKSQLNQLANLLSLNKDLNITLRGYTDSRGSSQHNELLSQKRAQVVEVYLEKKGVDSNRIAIEYHGEEEILNGCVDDVQCEEGQHAINRRAEIKFSQRSKS